MSSKRRIDRKEIIRRIKELSQELRVLSLQLSDADESQDQSDRSTAVTAANPVPRSRRVTEEVETEVVVNNSRAAAAAERVVPRIQEATDENEIQAPTYKEQDRVVIRNNYQGLRGKLGTICRVTPKTVDILLDGTRGKIVTRYKRSVEKIDRTLTERAQRGGTGFQR